MATKTTRKSATSTDKPTAKRTSAAPKKDKANVLFVSPEAFPFAGTGGLGEVAGSLPMELNKLGGVEARVIMPLYDEIPKEYREKLEFVTNITVGLSWRNQYCGLFKTEYNGVIYYFIDNEYYFKRGKIYGYFDDGERFAFFSRAVLCVVPYLDFKPNVMHINDHTCGLVPVYYRLQFANKPGYKGIKMVYTIHNLEYQGVYSMDMLGDVLGLDDSARGILEFNGNINNMKGALVTADKITTVSQTYAKEIRLPENSYGLDGILIENRDKLIGILNGISDDYNPEIDPALFQNYGIKSLDDKAKNKAELQRLLSLPQDPNIPMIGMVTRLVKQKGLDLVRKAINETLPGKNVLSSNVQIVILGRGDSDYESYFEYVQNTYNNRVRVLITYNKDLAQKIYAASDVYLMPSRFEPCGLSQMVAAKYGTIPIVRACGGLYDSIHDYDKSVENGTNDGNGFVFEEYNAEAMDDAITRATKYYYYHKDTWRKIMENAMNSDFSWKASAEKYLEVYNDLLK